MCFGKSSYCNSSAAARWQSRGDPQRTCRYCKDYCCNPISAYFFLRRRLSTSCFVADRGKSREASRSGLGVAAHFYQNQYKDRIGEIVLLPLRLISRGTGLPYEPYGRVISRLWYRTPTEMYEKYSDAPPASSVGHGTRTEASPKSPSWCHHTQGTGYFRVLSHYAFSSISVMRIWVRPVCG